jgi:hypothetical protein
MADKQNKTHIEKSRLWFVTKNNTLEYNGYCVIGVLGASDLYFHTVARKFYEEYFVAPQENA